MAFHADIIIIIAGERLLPFSDIFRFSLFASYFMLLFFAIILRDIIFAMTLRDYFSRYYPRYLQD